VRNEVAYNLIVAGASPALRKLCQSVFPEESFKLYLVESLEELNQLLDNLIPEALILSSSLLEVSDGLPQLQNKLSGSSRIPVFLVGGSFEPLPKEYWQWIKPEKVFLKPFYSESLAQAVREAVEKRRIPDTLPEELPESLSTRTPSSLSYTSPSLMREIRLLIQQEVLEAERELEKRLRTSLQSGIRPARSSKEAAAGKEKKEQVKPKD
jgi:DNA-binding NtrC family response regulator